MRKSFFFATHILSSFGFLATTGAIASAQVTTDNTVNTQVNQNGGTSEITGGEARGENLFHSFQDFSIGTGNEAYFNNAETVNNIFSRVTGGNISTIDGGIRANGSANLFLINPAGIIFGEASRLDIGGSFYGSSANSILFSDGVEFAASDTSSQPILTVNAPIGLNFRDSPGDIINRSNFGFTTRVLDENFDESFADDEFTTANSLGLTVNPGETLALIGGDVALENVAGMTAPGGRIELGGLSQSGTVAFNDNGSLTFPVNTARGNVSLVNNSEIDVSSDGGGFVNINANQLELEQFSRIFAGIAEGSVNENAQAGDINISATESISLSGDDSSNTIGLGTEINNHVGTAPNRRSVKNEPSNAVGNGGNIIINTPLLFLEAQARITANSYANGNSGSVMINTDNIDFNGGTIAGLVFGGVGDVGNVTIKNANSINLGESSNILTQVLMEGEGDAGNIVIDTGTFSINGKFSFVLADNRAAGNAGNISINAKDSIFINGGGGEGLGETLSAIITQVDQDVIGNAGNIDIATPQLSLTNFGLISTNVRAGSVGTSGKISLDVGTLSLNNGSVISALTESSFDGGNITIDANAIELSNGGKIVTSGDGGGNAGSIDLNIADSLSFRNDNPPIETPFEEPILVDSALETGLFASTVANATGNGGSIDVQANSIQFRNNGSVLATTTSGTGGNVTFDVEQTIFLRKNSLISAQAGDIGDGGNINIDTNFIVASPNGNSDIVANANQGQGGNININAEFLLGIAQGDSTFNNTSNDIDASSQFGLAGNVSLNIFTDNFIGRTVELPANIFSVETIAQDICSTKDQSVAASGFTIRGKGGVINPPGMPLDSQNIIVNGKNNNLRNSPRSISTGQGKIIPARGIKVTKAGGVVLTGDRTDSSASRIVPGSEYCGV